MNIQPISALKALFFLISVTIMTACSSSDKSQEGFSGKEGEVVLITLDPGHFHAHLVQKSMYDQVDPKVYVYAPDGQEVKDHLEKIQSYNTRAESPTSWQQEVYLGNDFLSRMISEKKGNVVVMAGNNQKKTEYIKEAIDAGLHVLADKPMAITVSNFELLKSAFEAADRNGVMLYDIMTERHEITSILQKEFSKFPDLFGDIEKGSPDNPAVVKESVHHFFKYVSGSVLKRPAWFFDVSQQGEGIVDVTTHLVDLIQWACFPGEIIDYNNEIEMISASRWPTKMSLQEFSEVTQVPEFPEYLKQDVDEDNVLNVYANGEINYTIRGIHSKVIVKWNYRAPEGAADTHYSIMRGTKANLVIRQGPEQNFKPILYVEKAGNTSEEELAKALKASLPAIQAKYPGIDIKESEWGWEIVVPKSYDVGHEAHFAQVTEKFLQYLAEGKLPDWEVPNMITKYYITTKALEMARQSK
ncbi:MAG: Gfo/Idh/MocA family oxidoreductase [Cyclobacteriaceae bacterium]|nr:Gfo/Idh/MocA family oxidoreductase [Cyclobacteriaceae bacterium]